MPDSTTDTNPKPRTTDARPIAIAPKPLDASRPNLSERAVPRTRKRRHVSSVAACVQCRAQKTRCDGSRPSCSRCVSRVQACEYDVEPGVRRHEAERRRMESLQTDNLEMQELIGRLRHGSPAQINDVLRQLREAGTGEESLSGFVGSKPGQEIRQLKKHKATVKETDYTTVDGGQNRQLATPMSDERLYQHDGILSGGFGRGNRMNQLLRFALPQRRMFEIAVSAYHQSVGDLFYTYTPEQAKELFAAVYTQDTQVRASGALTQLCAIAATGSMFSKGQVRGDLTECFYGIARHYLDALIEEDILSAIKVVLMLGLSNIVYKSTVALSYLNQGLFLSRQSGLQRHRNPRNISKARWLDHRRVWRTLTLCNGWIASTTGVSADTDWFLSLAALRELDLGDDECLPDIIQMEIAKVSTLKASMLSTLSTSVHLEPSTISRARNSLRSWHDNLPHVMTLASLTTDSLLDTKDRIKVLYVHLMYLGGMMLLPRCLIRGWKEFGDTDGSLLYSTEAVEGVQEGFVAAQQSTRVLGLLSSVEGVVKKCWLCTFQSYTSSLMILFAISQRFLLEPDGDQSELMTLADGSLSILAFCATEDRVARTFQAQLMPHVVILKTAQSLRRHTTTSVPGPVNHPFFIPTGETDVHNTARSLLEMLAQPFSAIPGLEGKDALMATQTNADETTLGSHLEWQWEPLTPFSETDHAPLEIIPNNLTVGARSMLAHESSYSDHSEPELESGNEQYAIDDEAQDGSSKDAMPPAAPEIGPGLRMSYFGSQTPSGWVESEIGDVGTESAFERLGQS